MFIRKQKYKNICDERDALRELLTEARNKYNVLCSRVSADKEDSYSRYRKAIVATGKDLSKIHSRRVKEFLKNEYCKIINMEPPASDELFILGKEDDPSIIQTVTSLLLNFKKFDKYLIDNKFTVRKK